MMSSRIVPEKDTTLDQGEALIKMAGNVSGHFASGKQTRGS
jgi:hypothetical protein